MQLIDLCKQQLTTPNHNQLVFENLIQFPEIWGLRDLVEINEVHNLLG